ncbi:MAG TPA: flavodoxin domain-containing protein [Kofleriaceae bacterium]
MQPHSQQQPQRRIHGRTLILVAESHGHTHAVATAIASRMRTAGHVVDVRDANSGSQPAADDYDAIILGADAAVKRDRRVLGDYVANHRGRLHDIPTGLFLVCESDRGADPHHFVDAFETRLGMRARFAAVFSYGRLRTFSNLLRSLLVAVLHYIDGAVADRGAKELRALADAMMNEVAKSRARR